jgi:chitodextrinase
MALAVPLTVFALIWPAPLPAPREYDYDCHDSGACAREASIPRPSRPRRLHVVQVASTSIKVAWAPRRRVVGYEVVADGRRVAVVRRSSFTFAGLACATRYRLVVRALGANGRRSHRTTLFATTRACRSGAAAPTLPHPVTPAPPTPTDRLAPSTPTGLRVGAIDMTSVALSWTASSDNVGVAGYSLLVNGTRIAQGTTSPAFTFTGLACGTRYTLGVQAFDAAGNASRPASRAVTTARCPSPQPPPTTCPSNPKQGVQVPGNLTVLDPANPCRTATGRVMATHIEHDGDCHVNIAVDPQYQGLLNAVNGSSARGQLITEVIPNHPLPIPSVGSRVTLVGSWVNDHSTGWNELHPVWSFQVLSGSTGAC